MDGDFRLDRFFFGFGGGWIVDAGTCTMLKEGGGQGLDMGRHGVVPLVNGQRKCGWALPEGRVCFDSTLVEGASGPIPNSKWAAGDTGA